MTRFSQDGNVLAEGNWTDGNGTHPIQIRI